MSLWSVGPFGRSVVPTYLPLLELYIGLLANKYSSHTVEGVIHLQKPLIRIQLLAFVARQYNITHYHKKRATPDKHKHDIHLSCDIDDMHT